MSEVDSAVQCPLESVQVSRTFRTLAERHGIPGAQLTIHHCGQTLEITFGVQQHGGGHPVGANTAFPVGSISKSFTAAVIMILAADGDCELDAPLGEVLPELAGDNGSLESGAESGARLTLRQVLSHTSGLASGPDSDDVADLSLHRYVRHQCRLPDLVLRPGTGFSYSNVGYALAGRLIETITGMTWWQAVGSILLKPLGIEPAFIPIPGGPTSERVIATGHGVNAAAGKIVPVEQCLAWAEAPAGGLALSATDLVRFGRATFAEGTPGALDLLPPDFAEELRTPVPGASAFGLADEWCPGLALFHEGDIDWLGHDGTADGTSCHLRIEPGCGIAVALTTNSSAGVHLWRDLLAALRADGFPVGDHVAELPDNTLPARSDCFGSYVNGDVEYRLLPIEDEGVGLAIDGELLAELVLFEGLVFDLRDVFSGRRLQAGRFLPNPDTGELDRIQVLGRLASKRQESVRC
ncbi:MAG: serine hydrolase domain-containing protein [Sciscionella sp.]